MKKHALPTVLLLICLLLSGCGSQQPSPAAPKETPLPTAPPQEAPTVDAQGKLADAARTLLAPYQREISLAADQSLVLLTYAIPGDLISQMARDAAEVNAEPENGRYTFTWRQSGKHTYTASAMQIHQIEAASEATPDPRADAEPVMDNQLMGDFSASGGGVFDRSRAYDVSEKLTEGTAEITDTLNGQITGHELFSFTVENGSLYFVDATLDQAVDLDGLVATDRRLVAAGVLRENGLDIVEFSVPSLADVPSASRQSWDQLLSQPPAFLSRLQIEGQRVTVTP